jgi:Ion channel
MANKPLDESSDSSEVIRFGGAGTVLLIALLTFIGLAPLLIGGIAGRIAGGLILAVILVAGTLAASRSGVRRAISIALAVLALGLQVAWLTTGNTTIEAAMMAVFAIFCLYTAMVILRRVLSFGPMYADRVHAALSVYILLALFWAGSYALIEIVAPGSFSINIAGNAPAHPEGARLLADMIHLSIATLSSTGYGDITPVAPFARSFAQLEQLAGIFYVAVVISRLVSLYPNHDRG